jgi:hypothetical protein
MPSNVEEFLDDRARRKTLEATGLLPPSDEKLAEIKQLAALAETAIAEHAKAVKTLRHVSASLANLERERSKHKTAAIVRLCQQENPATPGKNYSPSQAADFAQLDPQYDKYKGQVQSFTLLKQEAEGNLATAKLAAQLAVALFRAEAGLI